mgnify:CR=1 FL=1
MLARAEYNDGVNYPSRPKVKVVILENFRLTIEAGQRVALVFCGLVALLCFGTSIKDPPNKRRIGIDIDRKHISESNLRWLRKQIGWVQQEPVLLSSSIRDNICYGSDHRCFKIQITGMEKGRESQRKEKESEEMLTEIKGKRKQT